MNRVHRLKPIVVAVAGVFAAYNTTAQVPPPTALPTGGRLIAGQATVIESGSNMLIRQGSDKAILNWNSFSIGSQAGVQFQQPSSSSIALNRVVGSDPSAIYGSLTANGQVFLLNPNGVVFGRGARVDVGGLVASTLNMRDADFLAGNYRFTRDGAMGSVINEGDLLGKYVALLAPEVRNEGVIVARQGTAALAAGEAVTLGITGNDLIGVQVDKASIDTLVQNGRLIQADAGTVILSAQSAHGLVGKVVNTDVIEAKGITTDGGTIRLAASSAVELAGSLNADAGANGKGGAVLAIADLTNPASSTVVSGTISARGGTVSGDGGFVETSARRLKVGDSARIDTRAPNGGAGRWLLDPTDFTIAAANGDMTGAALSTNLNTTDVTIQSGTGAVGTNGDVFVNDSVSWGSGRTLTLSAAGNVYINAPIDGTNNNGAGTGTGAGKLELRFGQSDFASNFPFGNYFVTAPVTLAAGANFKTVLGDASGTGPDAPLVTDFTVIGDATGLANISGNLAGNYALGRDIAAPGSSWTPLGSTATPFTGTFDGLGHRITGLMHTNAGSDVDVGLFGGSTGLIQNVGLTGVNIAGSQNVGALAGYNNGFIVNSYATGIVQGTGTGDVGRIGGLVGFSMGPIAGSYANVTVTATSGDQAGDPLAQGKGGIGGLAGVVGTSVMDSYARGDVSGGNAVGGLVGYSAAGISNSYSTGAVSGSTNVNGLIGQVPDPFAFTPFVFNSFWDTQTSGQVAGGGGTADIITGLNTADMKTPSNFAGAGWDTAMAWELRAGQYPMLKQMLQPILVIANNRTTTYNGSAVTGFTTSISPATTSGSLYTGTAVVTPSTSNPTNAGTYTLTPSGISVADDSDQHGYRIQFVNGTLIINAAPITYTITGNLQGSVSKVYDGNSTITGLTNANFSTSGWQGTDGATISKTTGTITDGPNASASTTRPVTVSLAAGDWTATGTTDFLNYILPTSLSGNIGEIRKADLTLGGTRVYTGLTSVAGSVLTATGVNGESFALTGAGTLVIKDVGTRALQSLDTLALGTASGGALAANYNALSVTGSAVIITKADLAVTGLTASNKVYDALLGATLGGTASVAGLGSDDVSVGGVAAGAFADKNVGTGKAVTVSGNTLVGTDAGNYNIVQQTGLVANITKADLAVTGLTANNKVYDGTLGATLGGNASVAGLGSDVVTVGGTATGVFGDKNAGNGKAITVSGNTLAGTDAGNYNIVQQTGLTADITKADLTLSGTRAYDGTTVAAGSILTAAGVNNETFSVTGAGDASNLGSRNANAAPQTLASVTGLALGTSANGGLAGNYNALGTTGSAVTVTRKALALLGLTAEDKTFDGTTAATLTGAAGLNGVVNAEDVRLDGVPSGAFADPNPGVNKPVTVSGLSLGGTGAANYTFTAAALSATIRPATSVSNTVANVVNSASKPLETTAGPPGTTTTQRQTTTSTTRAPEQTTTTVQQTTTTEAPPPSSVSAVTSNPTPQPGQSVPIRVPANDGAAVLDPAKPVAAVMIPGDGSADIPMPAPKITMDANGNLSVDVTVPPATPPGVYVIAVVGTDANGKSRVIILPVVVRRRVAS